MASSSKIAVPDRAEWSKNRYALFNAKVDSFSAHPQYAWLRKYADDAIRYNEGVGYYMIKAAEVIKRIEEMDLGFIGEWLDGKNHLKWDEYADWWRSRTPNPLSEQIQAAEAQVQPPADKMSKMRVQEL